MQHGLLRFPNDRYIRMRTSFVVSLACVLALWGCGDDRPTSVSPNPAIKAAALSGGQRSAALQAVRARLEHSTRGLEAELLPDGVRRVRLQGRFLNLSILDAQGRAVCVDSPEALDQMAGSP
jgi:hypothetical protein